MTNFENLTARQKLRASIHKDTRTICIESCHMLGLEITKPAIEIISELVYKKLALYGTDLEAFSKHAKRQTVNADDVKLLVRRNPSLVARLTALTATNPAGTKEKRRKTVTLPVAKQPETPKPKEKENAEKSPVADRPSEGQAVESMVVDMDNTIDLTFD